MNDAQFSFTVANPIPQGGRVYVTFPAEFDVSNDEGYTAYTLNPPLSPKLSPLTPNLPTPHPFKTN